MLNSIRRLSQRPLPSTPRTLARWPLLVVLSLAGLGAWIQVQAQDLPQREGARKVVYPMAATGPRSSPFTPPDKDVFLTDASPGLDTGCTYNTSALNPLTIDIAVDRFVGDVDGNGFLINPAPLIAAGIIPSGVDILLPAFDIDYFGAAPPERDEVLFNGQSLGFLTGDDNVWKLNSFRVDIRKIKFPSRPAPGAQPGSVNNRLQIRIDTLSVGRWCMQVDWVALVVPIRPKLGLDLEVVAGNAVASNSGTAITKIQEQTFDANCNVTTPIGPIEQYPFSGPALTGAGGAGSAKLKATIKACPEGSLKPPEVTADWAVDGTAQKGTLNWSGLVGTVELNMPAAVGTYTATLKLKLDNGQDVSATRRVFVTRKAPLVVDPRINWYEKGTQWASGQTDENPIVSKVVSGLYGYGNANWRYAYRFGAAVKCDWNELMNDPISCNYSDCYVFSDVLDNIAGTLGVGSLAPITLEGTHRRGFLTTGSPSLDPAFRGSARPLGSAVYDRYDFSSHSLRLRDGVYYDSTFNGRYAIPTIFIAANYNGGTGVNVNGRYKTSDEGPHAFRRPGSSYDSWGKYDYLLTVPAAPTPVGFVMAANKAAGKSTGKAVPGSLISFAGVAGYRTPDLDNNRRFEAVEVDLLVDIVTAGNYILFGELQTATGQLVANRPDFSSMLQSSAEIGGAPGRRTVTLRFSGEQIRQSRIDGPYNLLIYANSDTEDAGSTTFATPALRWVDFGELRAQLRSLLATPVDADVSGKFETLHLTSEVEVANAGPYQMSAGVMGRGSDLILKSRLINLVAGVQTVTLDLPAGGIARSGIDGPYDVSLRLATPTGTSVDGTTVPLVGYLASQFEAVVGVNSNLVEQLIDSNGNALFDLLRVGADVSARAPRGTLVRATLVGANGASVATDVGATLVAGTQRLNFDFSGPQIRRMQMDSAYQLQLSFRDPATFEEFDAARVALRGVYIHTRFDPAEAPRAIALTGTRSDRGIDTNANVLFDKLQIDLGVELLAGGTFDWSARLVDRNGLEIGFATNRGNLAAGLGQIRLEFDGRPIGANGFDGPYFVRSLLISGTGGANLVSPFAGETSAWRANQFEGFVVRAPADINGDGVVDARDLAAFNLALGSSVGEPNYNRFADFDRDGRITLNDLRLFRGFYRR